MDNVAARVAELLGMDIEQVWQPGKFRPQVQARRLLCYWAVRELGESMTAMARRLGIFTVAVSKAVARGLSLPSKTDIKSYQVNKARASPCIPYTGGQTYNQRKPLRGSYL